MSNIDRVMNAARELNKNIRNEHMAQMMPLYMYLQEFGTVEVNCGRLSGKTDYILANAEPGDLIILPHNEAVRWFHQLGFTNAQTIKSALRWLNGQPASAISDNIWVDEPFLSFEHQENLREFYFATAKRINQTYIFLGA
jgi:hypothetical protein